MTKARTANSVGTAGSRCNNRYHRPRRRRSRSVADAPALCGATAGDSSCTTARRRIRAGSCCTSGAAPANTAFAAGSVPTSAAAVCCPTGVAASPAVRPAVRCRSLDSGRARNPAVSGDAGRARQTPKPNPGQAHRPHRAVVIALALGIGLALFFTYRAGIWGGTPLLPPKRSPVRPAAKPPPMTWSPS